METNVMGTLNVLEQFDENVVFASSSAVNYPTTPYAISKITCEHLCKLYGARMVRLCNIYGPGGHGVFQKFEAADVMEIAGMGDQVRTYAPVEDALAALIEAPSSPKGSCTILHGEDLTVMGIVNNHFPGKPYKRVPRALNDILDGRQICPQ
jgi:nucleoside-diphosphate-sugar epimerase